MSSTLTPLEQRLNSFLSSLADAEAIDRLPLTPSQGILRKADYLLNDRQIVCELKSIQTDSGEKIERMLEPHRARSDWPQFYGTWELSRILARLPDGKDILREVLFAITSSIENLFGKANRQIRSTKAMFGLQASHGLLIILNDLVEVLSPSLIGYRVQQLIRKRTSEGRARYPEVAAVWVLSETHDVLLSPGQRASPSIIASAHSAQHPAVAYTTYLHARWAQFNRLRVTQGSGSLRELERMLSPRSRDRPPLRLPRHELWQRQYQANPYLRPLPAQELYEYGAKAIGEAVGSMLRGAPKRSPEEISLALERFAHFIEEINHRAIDLRDWGPKVRDIIQSRGYFRLPNAGLGE